MAGIEKIGIAFAIGLILPRVAEGFQESRIQAGIAPIQVFEGDIVGTGFHQSGEQLMGLIQGLFDLVFFGDVAGNAESPNDRALFVPQGPFGGAPPVTGPVQACPIFHEVPHGFARVEDELFIPAGLLGVRCLVEVRIRTADG